MMVGRFVLAIVFGVLGPAIGFVIVAVKASGRARSLGLLGFAISGVLGMLTAIGNDLLPMIMEHLRLSFTVVGTVWSIVVTLVGLVPLILLAIAITANRSPVRDQAAGYPAAGYGPYQSTQPGGQPSDGRPTGG